MPARPVRRAILPAALIICALLAGGGTAAEPTGADTSAASVPAARPAAESLAADTRTITLTASPAPTPSASPSPTPQTVPAAAAFRRARAWLAGRAGYTALAVVDSSGKLYGWNQRRRFVSGSVTKAMLLVSYLRSHGRDPLSTAERDLLTRMIELSDNRAADVIYGRVGGDRALRAGARLAGMRDFAAERGFWGYATITAADQVRFFCGMDELIPPRHREFARHVLSNLIAWQQYGLIKVGRWYGWQSFTKGGWRSGLHGGRLIHQVSRLEKDGVTIAVAVLTDGQPTRKYARETIQGVALKLLRE